MVPKLYRFSKRCFAHRITIAYLIASKQDKPAAPAAFRSS